MAVGSTQAGRAHVDVDVDGSNINEGIVDAIEDSLDDVGDIGERAGRRYGDRFSPAFLKRLRSKVSRMDVDLAGSMRKAGEESGEDFSDGVEKSVVGKMRDVADKASAALSDRMASKPEAMRRGLQRAFDDDFATRLGSVFAEQFSAKFASQFETQIAALHKASLKFLETEGEDGGGGSGGSRGRTTQSNGDRIGKMFGAGGRSNIMNMFGKSIGLSINMADKASGAFKGMFDTFKQGSDMVTGGPIPKLLGGLQKLGGSGLSKMGTSMSGLGASAAAAGPAIIAVFVAISMLVAVASALLGIVIALAATIASALVGGLAIAGGALIAVAGAAGLATAAFMSMTDAQREAMAVNFTPLKEMMVGIGQEVLGPMAASFATWSQNLQNALMLLAPMARSVGEALGQAGSYFTAALSGPGFQNLAASLGVYLPGIIRNLSAVLGQFLNGAAGMFAVIMPYVSQFGFYLSRVTSQFSAFANSGAGQNSISNFVFRAVESLKSLWGAVREIGGLIADVFFNPAVQQAGATIFDGIADTFAGLRESIAEAYASGDLQNWLADAIEFGSALWGVIESLGGAWIAFYNSGVLQAVSGALEVIGWVIDALNPVLGFMADFLGVTLPIAIAAALAPLAALAASLIGLVEGAKWIAGKVGLGDGGNMGNALEPLKAVQSLAGTSFTQFQSSTAAEESKFNPQKGPSFTMPQLGAGPSASSMISNGNRALNATSASHGGYLPDVDATKKTAESLRKVLRRLYSDLKEDLRGIASAANPKEVRDALEGMRDKILDAVEGRGPAARRKGQAALDDLAGQGEVSSRRVKRLLNGFKAQNATLADYAAARNRVSIRLEKANEKLEEAIAMRKEYKESVVDAVKSFGSLITAEAKVIDGVTQALSADDITSNLRDRLAEIKKFQSDLQILLGMGLSDSAYKQLVDAGVEQGGAFAAAMVEGGYGSVVDMNSTVAQIDSAAAALGREASDRLYTAGVDAARGLVDGLESLSDKLDAAATKLGNKIAKALKKSLGIKSPSRVMIAAMGDVGDGIEDGLDSQHAKVSSAMGRLSSQIAVSPEIAAYSARQNASAGVSGNQNTFELTVVTPTEDPKAVALETMNELTGRIL